MSMPIGVGIVIDDLLDSNGDTKKIITQLESKNIPLVKFKQLPEESIIQQFGAVSFLILDWDLSELPQEVREQGVSVASTENDFETNDKLSFIKHFHKSCFAPVFIFTKEAIDPIKDTLRDNALYYDNNNSNFVFLKRKSELTTGDVVCQTIESWVNSTPVIHLITEWNRKVIDAQSRMFSDFYQGSHLWPEVMASSFKSDDTNPTEEMRQVLLRNLAGRLSQLDFDFLANASSSSEAFPHEAIIAILEKMTVIPNDCLENQFGCGDLFASTDALGTLYRINIRCDCDYIHADKPELFLLNGREVFGTNISEAFHPEQGFKRELSSAYIFPVNDGKCVRFQFKDFKRVKVEDIKLETRIGRLQPPYITDIRQRHAQWIQREGFPHIPYEVIDKLVIASQPEYQI